MASGKVDQDLIFLSFDREGPQLQLRAEWGGPIFNIKTPMMPGTDDLLPVNPPLRERPSLMDAEVRGGVKLIAQSKKGDLEIVDL